MKCCLYLKLFFLRYTSSTLIYQILHDCKDTFREKGKDVKYLYVFFFFFKYVLVNPYNSFKYYDFIFYKSFKI